MVFTYNQTRLVSSILLILMALNTFFIPANAFWYNSVTPKNSSHLTMNSIPDINPNYVSGTELSRPNMSDSSFSSNQNQSLNYNSGFSVNSSSQILINSTNNDPHILTMSSNSVNSIQSNYFSDPFNFSTEFIDIDANQKYDYLAFSFYINIFTFDNYRININAYSFNTSASRGYNYTIMPLQFGIQKVSLLFPYLNYYRDNFTSYSFNYLSIQNSNSLLYSNSSILAISKSISYTELEPRAIFFTGVASFIPWNKIPENSFTTQYEYINASIEVNITKSGNYDVAGILQVQELGLQYGYYFYHIGSSLKGVITVNLTFTSYLVQKYFNYTLSMNDLHIDLNNVRLESIAEISALQIHPNTYSPDQFDPSFEVISIWDQPIDYDNNGLMDAIGLKIKINTTEILGNTWIALLLANSTGTFIEKDFYYSFNSIGLLTFNITITVDEIYLTQLYDIVKIAALTIYDQSPWDYLFIGRNISLSQNYSVLTMDKPSISILDKQAYFEDANGDGLNEFQVLNITIQSKNYFSGRLDFNFGISWSGGGSTGLPFSYYFIINNETKSFIIKRSLQSYVYFQNYLNGDFQSNITLDINNFHFKNMTANSDLFTNYLFIKYPTIKYSEFNIHQLSLAINQVTFLDLNNDGLYDTLNISVNIFSIRDMMSKIQMNIPSAFINYWTMLIQKGNNTYSLMMPMVQSYWYLGSSNYSFKFYSIQELVYTPIFNYAYLDVLYSVPLNFSIGTILINQWSTSYYSTFQSFNYQLFINDQISNGLTILEQNKIANITLVLNANSPLPYNIVILIPNLNFAFLPNISKNRIFTFLINITSIFNGYIPIFLSNIYFNQQVSYFRGMSTNLSIPSLQFIATSLFDKIYVDNAFNVTIALDRYSNGYLNINIGLKTPTMTSYSYFVPIITILNKSYAELTLQNINFHSTGNLSLELDILFAPGINYQKFYLTNLVVQPIPIPSVVKYNHTLMTGNNYNYQAFNFSAEINTNNHDVTNVSLIISNSTENVVMICSNYIYNGSLLTANFVNIKSSILGPVNFTISINSNFLNKNYKNIINANLSGFKFIINTIPFITIDKISSNINFNSNFSIIFRVKDEVIPTNISVLVIYKNSSAENLNFSFKSIDINGFYVYEIAYFANHIGENNIQITVNDNYNSPVIETSNFSVIIIPPSVTIISPTSSPYNTNSLTFLYNTTNSNIVIIYIDNIANTTTIQSGFTLSSLIDGKHNITIVVYNFVGDKAQRHVLFTIDTIVPVVFITSPSDISYNSRTVSIFYSIDEKNSYSTIIFLDGVANTTSWQPGYKLSSLNEGQHNITIVVTDQAGNINIQQVLFDINTIARTTTTSLSVSSTQTSSSSTEKTSTVLTETSVISSTFNIIQTSPGFEVFLFIITLLGLIIDKRIIRNHKKN